MVSLKQSIVTYFHHVYNTECCSVTETASLERRIRNKLKDIMMTVDLEEVTSKYVRSLYFYTLANVLPFQTELWDIPRSSFALGP